MSSTIRAGKALGLMVALAACAVPVREAAAPNPNCIGRADLLGAPTTAGSTLADALDYLRGSWLVRAGAWTGMPHAAPVRVYANGHRLAGDLAALTTIDVPHVASICWLPGFAASAKYGSENESGAFDITWAARP
jgi:hypothetical protein